MMKRKIKLNTLIAISAILFAGFSQAEPTIVGIYTNGKSIEPTAKIFAGGDFEVHTVLNESVADFCSGKGNVLVVPAGEILHHSVREHIDAFMKNAGSLILLNSDAMNYDKFTISAPVATIGKEELFTTGSDQSRYEIVKSPKSNFQVSKCAGGLCMQTAEGIEIGGSCFVEILSNFSGELLSKAIEVEIKGDIQLDILTVRLLDGEGSSWVGFAEMSHKLGTYRIALADMLAENDTDKSIGEVGADDISAIQIGIDNRVVWGESGGQICIKRASIISYDRNRYPLSGGIIRYRTQFKAVGAKYPDWLFNPIVSAEKVYTDKGYFANCLLSGQGELVFNDYANAINTTMTYPGGNVESYLDVIKRDAFRPISLIKTVAGEKESDVAVLNVYSDGDYAGSSVAMFGLSQADYENEMVGGLLRKTATYMSKSVKILDCIPDTKASRTVSGEYGFEYQVKVYNPSGEELEGKFALDLAGGILTSQKQQKLAANSVSSVVLDCGLVPQDFPFTKFAINLTVNTDNGNDALNYNVDVEKTLIAAAEHSIAMQPVNFIDSAYTHWFYSDSYTARMLRGLGEYLDNQHYVNSGMRWANAMVAMQLDNGAYPMGYGMKRGIYYIADNGSIALAVAQLGSFAADIERRAMLDSVGRAFDWRLSYLVTEERSKELEERFGKDAEGTQVGNYGVGTVRLDHVTGGKIIYDFVQPEYRGVWYTLGCTVGFPAAMIALDGDQRYIDGANADGRIYIDRGLTVTGSYAPEGVLWLYKYVQDEQLKQDIKDRLVEKFIGYFPFAAERFWLYQGARQTLLVNPLVYAMRNIDNSSLTRAAVLESVVGLCGDYSPYSMMRVAENYPKATFSKANNEATMYLSFGSFGLMELLSEGSTMLKQQECR